MMIGNDSTIDTIYKDFISYLYYEIVPGSRVQLTIEEFEKSLQQDISIPDRQSLEEGVDQLGQSLFQPAMNHASEVEEGKENAGI